MWCWRRRYTSARGRNSSSFREAEILRVALARHPYTRLASADGFRLALVVAGIGSELPALENQLLLKLLAISLTIGIDRLGNYEPSQRPMGVQESTWSQTTLMVAVIGTARSKPMPPQSQPQNRREMVAARAFTWTRRPISAGVRTLAATKWRKVIIEKMPTNAATE